MNVIYEILDALQPSVDQIRQLGKEAAQVATIGSPEDQRLAALFIHQLREHVRRRRHNAAYALWLQDCLAEWNDRFGDQRTLFAVPAGDYEPGDLVEFAEDGDAYPHGCGGTSHVRRAVTPWEQSEHYFP
jgi:hypothetical protein